MLMHHLSSTENVIVQVGVIAAGPIRKDFHSSDSLDAPSSDDAAARASFELARLLSAVVEGFAALLAKSVALTRSGRSVGPGVNSRSSGGNSE